MTSYPALNVWLIEVIYSTYFESSIGTYSVTITPQLVITTMSLPPGSLGTGYTQTIAATGGTGAYTFSLSTGSIPGLTLSPSGILSGTPAVAGKFSVLLPEWAFWMVRANSAVHRGRRMTRTVVGARFQTAGRMYFFEPGPVEELALNEWVIVQTELGQGRRPPDRRSGDIGQSMIRPISVIIIIPLTEAIPSEALGLRSGRAPG